MSHIHCNIRDFNKSWTIPELNVPPTEFSYERSLQIVCLESLFCLKVMKRHNTPLNDSNNILSQIFFIISTYHSRYISKVCMRNNFIYKCSNGNRINGWDYMPSLPLSFDQACCICPRLFRIKSCRLCSSIVRYIWDEYSYFYHNWQRKCSSESHIFFFFISLCLLPTAGCRPPL